MTYNTSNSTNVGFEILTANRMKLGCNNFRSLEGAGFNIELSNNPTDILKRNREKHLVSISMYCVVSISMYCVYTQNNR